MTEFDLNSDLTAAVTRWREYREPCPPDIPGLPRPNPTVHRQDCLCGGTNYVQPTIVKVLIEAVTTRPYGQPHSYFVRDWEEIGEGALEGVLKRWYFHHDNPLRNIPNMYLVNMVGDSVFLAAVDKALERMFGGKQHDVSR